MLVPPLEICNTMLWTAYVLQCAAFHSGVWLTEAPFPHLP